MKKRSLFLRAPVLAVGLSGVLFLASAWAGGEFEPTFPKFPYGPTDPNGNPYCVAATDLVYSPKTPYVRASSEVAKIEKSKRSAHRSSKKKAAPVDFKGLP